MRHEYFRTLTFPRQAYVLGLLASDGNVFGTRVSLELAVKDTELVELVRDQLAPSVALRSRRRATRGYVIFSISSRPLVGDLASLGVVERKSRTFRWPEELPISLARPFLLGYFDGDGFITWSRTQHWVYPRWGLLGTEGFLEAVNDLLAAELGIRRRRLEGRAGCHRLSVSGRDAFVVDKWLHEGFEFGLGRKRFTGD